MGKFTESMNMKFGRVGNAQVIEDIRLVHNFFECLYDTCRKSDIDLVGIPDNEILGATDALESFCKGANEETGYTVSVWFD